jgi:hypothetical protein
VQSGIFRKAGFSAQMRLQNVKIHIYQLTGTSIFTEMTDKRQRLFCLSEFVEFVERTLNELKRAEFGIFQMPTQIRNPS